MKDLKYLAAMTLPISAIIGLYFGGYWSFFTPFYAFVIIPIFELLLPVDTSNYDQKERQIKKNKRLFDWLLYLNVPIVYGLLVYSLWYVSSNNILTYEIIGFLLSLGIVLGTNGINVAHELGHRLKTN